MGQTGNIYHMKYFELKLSIRFIGNIFEERMISKLCVYRKASSASNIVNKVFPWSLWEQ